MTDAADRVVPGQRLVGKHIDAGAKAPLREQLGQRVEVDDLRPAQQQENRVTLDEA
jgi:hypothetical protein